MLQHFGIQITQADHKRRLDEFLFNTFPKLSRLYLRELVRDEKCEVNGRYENRGYILRSNDYVEIEIDTGRQTTLEPEDVRLDIVFEDREFLVVNKPSGMLVHPTVRVRTGTLLNALAHHLNIDPDSTADFVRAGLVHRLDKDTSGLIVIAKNPRSHRILCSHFQRKLVEKRYFAVVEGILADDSGTIEAPIGRFAEERIWNIKEDGKNSISRYVVKERRGDSTLVELEPVTGRTNQLRIHLAHIGHPIVGDIKYGGRAHSRLCLHAFKLELWHPNGGEQLTFELPLPNEMN